MLYGKALSRTVDYGVSDFRLQVKIALKIAS